MTNNTARLRDAAEQALEWLEDYADANTDKHCRKEIDALRLGLAIARPPTDSNRVTREEAFELAIHAGVRATERIDQQCMATGVLPMTEEQRQVLAGQVALNFVEFLRSLSVQAVKGDDFGNLTDDNLPDQFLQWLKTSGHGAA